MTTTATRGPRGEGSVSRKHTAKAGCPPVVNGIRPEHRCKALWRARLPVVVGGRRTIKEVTGKTQQEAVKAKAALQAKANQGRLPRGGKLTVAAWVERWYAEEVRARRKVSTWQAYRSRIDTWIVPYLGTIRLEKLEGEHIEQLYAAMRAKGRSESTVNQVHCNLHKCLTVARRRHLINFNPCDDVEPPSKRGAIPRRPLTVDEVWRVLDEAGDDPRYPLALMTGLRQGEALALRWSDLKLRGSSDLPAPHLVVERACTFQRQVGWTFHTAKTVASNGRKVPLPALVVKKLSKARAKAMLAGAGPDDLVFRGARSKPGCPISATTDERHWVQLLQRAGVPDPTKSCVHAARHTFAGLLESAGVNDRVVATILGHASASITHHYQEQNQAPLVEAMGEGGLLETYLEKHHHQGGAAA